MEKKINELCSEIREQEKELYKVCPKMSDPDWWENGSDLAPEQEAKMDKEAEEWADKMKKTIGN